MNNNNNSKKIKFKIYSQETYNKKIVELKKIRKILHPNEINKIMTELFNFPIMFGLPIENSILKNFSIYRARAVKKGEKIDENNFSEFSYPPEEKCKRLRCNIKGQQVLYTASDPNTAIFEIKKQIIPHSTLVYLSEWGINELQFKPAMHMVFHGLPEEGETHSSIFASICKKSWSSMIHNLPNDAFVCLEYYLKAFQELFTYRTSRYYHLSSAYIYNIFENVDDIIDPNGTRISIPIVAYPSVAKDKQTANFVFKKHFVDKHLYIKYVDKLIVTSFKNGIVLYRPIARGVIINDKISWLPYQIKVSSSEYGWAFLSANQQIGQDLEKVGINEQILRNSLGHKISVNQYLSEKGITYKTLLNGIKQMTKEEASVNGLGVAKKEMISFINVSEKIYWNDKKINQIGFPFWYKIGYQ